MKVSRFAPSLALCLALLLSSCNLPIGQPTQAAATPGLSALEISASQTAAVAPSETFIPPSETASPLPSETATTTWTLTPSLEPSATETATPEKLMALVLKETNCRSGPGSMYERIAIYQADTQLELIAKDLGGGYWYARNPAKPEEQCWIIGTNIKIEKEKEKVALTSLPPFTPPPSPTLAPDIQVKFKNYDKCGDRFFLRFEITNTGGFTIRSAYLSVTDLKKNVKVETSTNLFHLTVGCVYAKEIITLEPGATGYLQTGYEKPDMFKYDPRANNLRAVIMACVEKNLKAPCVTTIVEIKNK